MADREKVIAGLECCSRSKLMDRCHECPYFSSCGTECGSFAEIAHDALALLKAQEPLNAIKLRNIKTTFRDEIKFEYSCPNCYSYLMKRWKACPVCGQEVKWE